MLGRFYDLGGMGRKAQSQQVRHESARLLLGFRSGHWGSCIGTVGREKLRWRRPWRATGRGPAVVPNKNLLWYARGMDTVDLIRQRLMRQIEGY